MQQPYLFALRIKKQSCKKNMDSKRTKTYFVTYKPLSFDMFNGAKKNPIDIEAKVLRIA